MQLGQDWLARQHPDDAMLLHCIDTAFLLHPPTRIGIAVSGGGDSVALLHLFHRWTQVSGVPIEAVTVDHGLRDAAVEEAAWVADLCARLGVAHTTLRWNEAPRGNVMAAARAARYRLIADWAGARGIGGVALGHTADDIAETFLMRLSRKAGLDGLAAMEARFERHDVQWTRPLWQQGRADLRTYLDRQGQDWLEDPTNADPGYDRTRAREVLAALGPLGIDAAGLTGTAHALFMARSALEHYTHQEARTHVTEDRGDLLIRRHAAPPFPPEIERRLLRKALHWVGGGAYPPRESALINLEAALALHGPRHTAAGCLVSEEAGPVWRISREPAAVAGLACPTTQVWDGRWRLDGPHAPGLEIRALGTALSDIDGWRDTGLPRRSLLASPSVWDGETLISAPLAGWENGWRARIVTSFGTFLVSH
ncbi:MAG: tRNA(Ile)-lysidine synthase TilS [Rhodobacteraceae bacterium HLUCCA08]|nr:MAG: tRNA(Ile)-lysidine synthase TilS [Rhodobacteraceae bacterium HLUCCA08]